MADKDKKNQQGGASAGAVQDPPPSESAPTNAPEPQGGASQAPVQQAPPPPAPPVAAQPPVQQAPPPVQRRGPSPLQMEILNHARLNGAERTKDLQRLHQTYRNDVVDAEVQRMVDAGVLDKGHVLTDKGQKVLEEFGD